jgi:tetratricopeptide (TPR) repeat protein
MSGHATFSGTTYQAGVIAYVAVHILTEAQLGWFDLFDDTPTAISGEVGGAGDDAAIEFRPGTPTAEIQAKHGLQGIVALAEVVERVAGFPATDGASRPVVLVTDQTASRWIYPKLGADLDLLRAERHDAVGSHTRELVTALRTPAQRAALTRLHIKRVDVDSVGDVSARQVIGHLSYVLSDPSHAPTAWRLLRDDAADMCRIRGRRTRADLVRLLGTHGIVVTPPPAIARLNAALDLSRDLLKLHKPHAALVLLTRIEKQLEATPDAGARYRLLQQRSSAYLQLRRPEDARHQALMALDHNPMGKHALITAALSMLDLGEEERAVAFAERATAAEPGDGQAWACLAHVCLTTGRELPNVPARASETVEYRLGLTQAFLNRGRTAEAAALIDGLLAEGQRTADLLMFKAQALTGTLRGVVAPSRELAEQIERLTTEAIDEHEASDYTIAQALLARSLARHAVGRVTDAEADIERAHHLEPDDPGPMLQAALTRLNDGDFRGVVQILSRPGIERFPMLIAIRAGALARLTEATTARKDVEEALKRLADAPEPNAVRLAIVDAALEIGDLPLSELMLAAISGPATQTARYALLQGRLAFAQGETEAARNEYRRAAEREPEFHDQYFAELGSRFVSIKRWDAAAAAFATCHSAPARALQQYAQALLYSQQIIPANDIVQRELDKGEDAADWALEYAAHIAIARDDVSSAADHLARLCAHNNATPVARLQLASLLLQLDDRAADALPIVAALANEAHTLPPDQQMAVARALYWTGDRERALEIGFRAYRAADDDPDIHRAFASLAMEIRTHVAQPDQVGPDTYVRLKKIGSDDVKEYVVFAAPPYNPAARHISMSQAETLHLIGLKVGDTTSLNDRLDRWEAVELKTAALHAVQDIIQHFEDRFADAPFFVKGFNVSEGLTNVADLAPMIMMLHQQSERRHESVQLFRRLMLPLGFLATRMDATIPDTMSYLRSEEGGAEVFVEWADSDGQQQSATSASGHSSIVLTESALDTAQRLELLDRLAARFALYAPHSLGAGLRSRLADAEELAVQGRTLMSADGPGLTLHKLAAGDPDVLRHRNDLRTLIAWVDAHVTLEPRPLGSVAVFGAEESSRDLFGHSSFDSVALALARGAALYADDLGLRRVAQADGVRSFSTPSLIAAWKQSGELAHDEANELTHRLIGMRYSRIPLTLELLKRLVRSTNGRERVEAIKNGISPPAVTLQAAGRVGVQLLKWAATEAILPDPLGDLTEVLLTAMAVHWPAPACAHAVLRAAVDEMSLLPAAHDAVRSACISFVASRQALGLPRRDG